MVIETNPARMLRFPLLLVVADYAYVADADRWLTALRTIGEAARGEAVAVQVRAKQMHGAELQSLAARAREAVPPGVPLFLNGDADLALSLGYSGVHWPEATSSGARHIDAPLLHCAAVHSLAAADSAMQDAADMLVYGSVYEPGSKPGIAAGTATLAQIARRVTVPVIAIGGITPERIAPCVQAGARGVGVVSGILGAPQPAEAVRQYLAALAVASTQNPAHATQAAQGEPTR